MRHCLIVANQTLTDAHLVEAVLARQASHDCEFYVLVPASHPHDRPVWTEGQAIAAARAALDYALQYFRAEGVDATGEVGDQNPVLAVGDVLNKRSVDEILLSTLPPGASKWLKRDLPHRLARRFGIPVTHVTATPVQV